MNFIETRGNDGKRPKQVTFSEAILKPMSSFGGIYSPESLPDFSNGFLEAHIQSDYKTLARAVLAAFEIDIEQSVIDEALDLYDKFDDPKTPAPLVKVKDNLSSASFTTARPARLKIWHYNPLV